jgi:hypothetical protein
MAVSNFHCGKIIGSEMIIKSKLTGRGIIRSLSNSTKEGESLAKNSISCSYIGRRVKFFIVHGSFS